jgi:glutamate carboxypeptidase
VNLDFLKQLVEIDSRTQNIEGVNSVQNLIATELKNLNFDYKFINADDLKTGKLLWGFKKGKSEKAISLICHSDTVIGPSSDFNFKIDYQNGKAYGPGIGDNKGGVSMLLGSLKEFFEVCPHQYYSFNFICSPSEETGSLGYHNIFKSIGEKSEFVFGFEPALSNGDIINERAGNRWYNILLKGKSGHAGRWNEPTINIAHVASDFISLIHPLSSFEKKQRINVAAINGGSLKYNVICDNIELKIDTRFKDFTSLNFLHNEIIKTLEKTKIIDQVNNIESSYSLEIVDDCPPMGISTSSLELTQLFLNEISNVESRKIDASYSGGAADINYFQRHDLKSLDGLGPIATKMHTKEESIEIESFFTRMKVFSNALYKLNSLKQ